MVNDMEPLINRAAAEWHKQPGAELATIHAVERATQKVFPDDYTSFLVWSNGGEGYLGTLYLSLWDVETIVQLNNDYQIVTYLPELLAIGTDGGGLCYALDFTGALDNPSFIRVPLGDLDRSSVEVVGTSFRDGIEQLLNSEV
jgi:hypothetical protein